MRRVSIFSAIAAAAIVSSAVSAQPAIAPATEIVNETATKRIRKAVAAGTLAQYRNGKNAPAKRKLRANRLHVSRRVRRKHRRAA